MNGTINIGGNIAILGYGLSAIGPGVGIGLILVGFTMQSVQYWVTLLDVTLR